MGEQENVRDDEALAPPSSPLVAHKHGGSLEAVAGEEVVGQAPVLAGGHGEQRAPHRLVSFLSSFLTYWTCLATLSSPGFQS